VVRLRPAATGATGGDPNQQSAARTAPWAAEMRGGEGSSVGSDRPSDQIGRLGPIYSGRVGRPGQLGLGLLASKPQPSFNLKGKNVYLILGFLENTNNTL
jgi:hypothetical protein